jgi:ribosome maturation factor RimP
LIAIDALEPVINPTVSGLGYELLGIERQRLPRGLLLRLYIDRPEGISLDDCERVSKQVRDLLAAENAVRDDYLLEVSSPGLDRPLFKLEHYRARASPGPRRTERG